MTDQKFLALYLAAAEHAAEDDSTPTPICPKCNSYACLCEQCISKTLASGIHTCPGCPDGFYPRATGLSIEIAGLLCGEGGSP